MSHPWLSALSSCLPSELAQSIEKLSSSDSSKDVLESLIRFLGGAPPVNETPDWAEKQTLAKRKLDDLSSTSSVNGGTKRPLDSQEDAPSSETKRPKLDSDPVLFTLNSISVTSPIRKKVNINVSSSSITFTLPNGTPEGPTIPLSSLKRAFIVPTRGKSKAHWTVIFLPSDIPEKDKNAPPEKQQIIFGVDAVTPNATFSYTTKDNGTTTLKKGDETLPALLAFLTQTKIPFSQPSSKTFKSACLGTGVTASKDEGIPGVQTYRSAKPGTLWFFEDGLLWGESKPCEFWACEDLAAGDGGLRGVRTISATGRNCSIYVTRRLPGDGHGDEEDGEEEVEETEFSMVDAKEQDGIVNWVRSHCHLFGGGGGDGGKSSAAAKENQPAPPANAGSFTIGSLNVEEDDDDEAYVSSSGSSDSGGEASDSEDGGDEGGGGEDGEGSAEETDGDDAEGEGAEEEEQDLDPAHHPLLRPGAMPKNVSKAAIEAVVGMVEQDVVMGGPQEDGAGMDEDGSGEEDEQDELDE